MGSLLSRQGGSRRCGAEGKVVLITGCSSGGTGHALALEFSRRGAVVYATSRSAATLEGLEEHGIRTLELDVTSQDSIKTAVQGIVSREGRIDVLVNNAGMSIMGPAADTPIPVWRSFYETNVFGAVALSQAVFPAMALRGSGRIVNIGSVAGICHSLVAFRPWASVYSSCKAALHCITNCMRLEMRPFGIDVILVAPGYIRTNIFSKGLSNIITLPEDSRFRQFEPLYQGLYVQKMQDQRNTLATVFAEQVVDASLRVRPPWRIITGSISGKALLLSWLPTCLRDRILWSMYGAATRGKGGHPMFP